MTWRQLQSRCRQNVRVRDQGDLVALHLTNVWLAAEMASSDNEDEDLEDDDEDDNNVSSEVPPYDPAKQEAPKLPIYHPGFALTEELGGHILSTFIAFFTNAINEGVADREANSLRKEIIKIKNLKYRNEIRIAVPGDTGSGKSASVNALLGVDGLSPEVCLLFHTALISI